MQESTIIELSKFGESKPEISLLDEIVDKKAEVEALISAYYFRSRGRVFNLRVDRESFYQLSDNRYAFVVFYKVGISNACADIDLDYDEKMVINVSLDTAASKALLTGEYIPEREPDDL